MNAMRLAISDRTVLFAFATPLIEEESSQRDRADATETPMQEVEKGGRGGGGKKGDGHRTKKCNLCGKPGHYANECNHASDFQA